jgi:hypothetical protein
MAKQQVIPTEQIFVDRAVKLLHVGASPGVRCALGLLCVPGALAERSLDDPLTRLGLTGATRLCSRGAGDVLSVAPQHCVAGGRCPHLPPLARGPGGWLNSYLLRF